MVKQHPGMGRLPGAGRCNCKERDSPLELTGRKQGRKQKQQINSDVKTKTPLVSEFLQAFGELRLLPAGTRCAPKRAQDRRDPKAPKAGRNLTAAGGCAGMRAVL